MEDKQGKVQMRQMNPIPFEMSSAAFSMSLCSRLSIQSKKITRYDGQFTFST